jgi:DNA polymerase elongation subunit (family B)
VFSLDPGGVARSELVGDITVRWFPEERALLCAFAKHVQQRDPDFVTGYNTDNFDLEWLGAAADRLGCSWTFWECFSRVKRDSARHRATGPGVKVRLTAPGRVPYDLLQWLKKNRQLEEYGLNFVAKTFGCGAKEDVEYSQIGELFQSPEGRLRLATYCCQDAALVLELLATKQLDPLGKDLALCAITGTFPADLLARGTQHTLRCKMLRVAHARGFVLPYVPRQPRAQTDGSDPNEDEPVGYQGGKVLTAVSGRYTDCVAVFDFASLYPSCAFFKILKNLMKPAASKPQVSLGFSLRCISTAG